MKFNFINGVLTAAMLLSAVPYAAAQNEIPASQAGVVIFGTDKITLENNGGVQLEIPTQSRYNFAVSGTKWLQASINNGKLVLNVDDNNNMAARSALLTVRTAAGASNVISVVQPGIDIASSAQAAADAAMVPVVWSKDACKNALGRANSDSESLAKSYDGNLNTLYHTNWNGFDPNDPEQWPVLEYYFVKKNADASSTVDVASVTYIPRNEGGENGRFGIIDLYVGKPGTDGAVEWTKIYDGYDLKKSASPSTIAIPAEHQTGLQGIKFVVRTGAINNNSGKCFASIAEMQFTRPTVADAEAGIFADAVMSALKPGTTQAQVDALTNPLYKQLAQMMLDGKYTSEGRVSTHEAIKHPGTLANEWNAPGKLYDQYSGITGVALTPGKYVVFVDGISTEKASVELAMFYWFGHEVYSVPDPSSDSGKREVKWGGESRRYTLKNGLNVIDIPTPNRPNKRVEGDDMALCYINNFDDNGLANGSAHDVTVHIVGGLVNGYISNTKSNAENKAVLDNAVYGCMDCVGTRTHCIWETAPLKVYPKGDWVKLINIYDQIIIWEHRVLGIEKYNRVPKNRTMAYVNYTYYMFQGGMGPSYMYNTQNRTLSIDNLLHNDSDLVWGLSHEWGHQHQMAPYFRWTGMAEVTNNIFSAYNVAHIGYDLENAPGRYPSEKWQEHMQGGKLTPARIHKIFLNDNYNREISAPSADGETKTANATDNIVMSLRSDAARAARNGNAFGWCKELKDFAQNQLKYPSKRFESSVKTFDAAQEVVNPVTALNAIEAYSGNNAEMILGPYVNLMYWFAPTNPECPEADQRPDLFPDFFEAMRQGDRPEGSTIEKTGIDKYEVLTSIFNGNKSTDPSINKARQFVELFPASVWATKKYFSLSETHNWQQNSLPAIFNAVRRLSRLTGYNLWSYFERYGVFTVCALEQGDYGTQYYICTQEMYDEFKADMYALEEAGELRPLSDELREKIFKIHAPLCSAPTFPSDRPILPNDN